MASVSRALEKLKQKEKDFLMRVLSVDSKAVFKESCDIKPVISIDTAIRIKSMFGCEIAL